MEIRGRGLLNAIVIDESLEKNASSDGLAWDICVNMAELGECENVIICSIQHSLSLCVCRILSPETPAISDNDLFTNKNTKNSSTTLRHISFVFITVGLLAKPTHGNIIRFAPPLCITDAEVSRFFQFIFMQLLSFPIVFVFFSHQYVVHFVCYLLSFSHRYSLHSLLFI